MDKMISISGDVSGCPTFNIYVNSPEKSNEEILEKSDSPELNRSTQKRGKEKTTQSSKMIEKTPTNTGAAIACSSIYRNAVDKEDKERKAWYERHKNNPGYFQMTTRSKGIVLIINNYNFRSEHGTRYGSDKDCDSLFEAFIHLGLSRRDIEEKYDLAAKEILLEVQSLAQSTRKASFYAIFIMSHGTNTEIATCKGGINVVTGSDGGRVGVKKIVDQFNVAHLKETPILIFFQACRGGTKGDAGLQEPQSCDEDDDGEPFESVQPYDDDLDDDVLDCVRKALPDGEVLGDVPDYEEDSDACQRDKTPKSSLLAGPSAENEADEDEETIIGGQRNIMLACSAANNYKCLRDEKTGSWFIQEICKQLRSPAAKTDDVISLMGSIHISLRERTFGGDWKSYRVAARTSHTFGKKKLFLFPGL